MELQEACVPRWPFAASRWGSVQSTTHHSIHPQGHPTHLLPPGYVKSEIELQ